jgi:hypothetical protein
MNYALEQTQRLRNKDILRIFPIVNVFIILTRSVVSKKKGFHQDIDERNYVSKLLFYFIGSLTLSLILKISRYGTVNSVWNPQLELFLNKVGSYIYHSKFTQSRI